jgi:hypothetical protein
MVYVGQTRSRSLIAHLSDLGFGEMTVRGELPPRRRPWAFDNGVFKDWRASRDFDVAAYTADVERVATMPRPDFVVVPDIVAGGENSLRRSLEWVPQLRGLAPLYLVVQDGMREAAVLDALEPFAGIFVGGTLPWKLRTGRAWVRLARTTGRQCHIGRVGTAKRVRWAKRIEADSIDSCLPLWSTPQLRRFRGALENSQVELFGGDV